MKKQGKITEKLCNEPIESTKKTIFGSKKTREKLMPRCAAAAARSGRGVACTGGEAACDDVCCRPATSGPDDFFTRAAMMMCMAARPFVYLSRMV